MRETTPRNQRIYLKIGDAGDGMIRLSASLLPPAYDEPMLVLLSRGNLPIGQPLSFLLVSDPTLDPDLHGAPGAAATVAVGAVTTGASGSAPAIVNSGTPQAAVLDFTLPAPRDPQDGLSAYQLARASGYGGTIAQWLTTLVGAAGLSAYEIARAAGYGGTQTQWLAALNGRDGAPATTLLGTLTVTETATVAITAGLRRVTVTTPASWNVKVGDDLVFAPVSLPTGNYAVHNAVVTAANTVQLVLTVPALALLGSYSIPCRVRRFN